MSTHLIIENDHLNHELIKKYTQLEELYNEIETVDDRIILDAHQANALILINHQIDLLLEMRRRGSNGEELLKNR